VERAKHSRGFGYGRQTLARMLNSDTEAKFKEGMEILRACEQKGEFATKYSSVFDLSGGEISIFVPGSDEEVKLNLQAELKRGAHYYDIPKIRAQLAEAPKPALSNMRSFLREFTAATNSNAEVTERVSELTRRFANGKMRQADFTPELWKQLKPMKQDIRGDLRAFGDFVDATFVGLPEPGRERMYRYKLEFKKAWVLEDLAFSEDGKLKGLQPQGVEWRHPLPL